MKTPRSFRTYRCVRRNLYRGLDAPTSILYGSWARFSARLVEVGFWKPRKNKQPAHRALGKFANRKAERSNPQFLRRIAAAKKAAMTHA